MSRLPIGQELAAVRTLATRLGLGGDEPVVAEIRAAAEFHTAQLRREAAASRFA